MKSALLVNSIAGSVMLLVGLLWPVFGRGNPWGGVVLVAAAGGACGYLVLFIPSRWALWVMIPLLIAGAAIASRLGINGLAWGGSLFAGLYLRMSLLAWRAARQPRGEPDRGTRS